MLLLLKYDDGLKTVKSSANCDAHSAESIFQTRSDICNIFYSRGMYEFSAKSGGKVMRRENEKLIIDGNAIYELDLECVRKKQGKQEGKKAVRKPYRGLKTICRREFLPRAWLKKKQGNVRMLLEYA